MAESCPIRLVNRDCHKCPFGKEGFCDYPYARLNAKRLAYLSGEKERLKTELVQTQSQLLLIDERIVEEILRQASRP
jgi:hypothetical protein